MFFSIECKIGMAEKGIFMWNNDNLKCVILYQNELYIKIVVQSESEVEEESAEERTPVQPESSIEEEGVRQAIVL
jgi:TfoX/Sxy family transcriptional regulator of competence genes